ncbi:MAG TPA: dihydropteroate synthase, partial [Gaiellaceae bacterium]
METRPPIEKRFPRPSVMGVVNVTPDSFSDGGVHLDPGVAIEAARRMVEEGASIVDVGGESTRPGSEGVSLDEELRRVLPVLEAIAPELPVSIDTAKAEVARHALELGAEMVNDVTALRADPELVGVVADAGAYLCLMHMLGDPRTMQVDPRYDDVAAEVAAFLEDRLEAAVAAGVAEERICLDPGIGFGKTVEQNLELVRRLDVLTALGRPVVVGFSRK